MTDPIVVTLSAEGEGIVAEEKYLGGSPNVGRSDGDIYLALGYWFHNNQDRLAERGITIAVDESAVPFEMARREKELSYR